MENNWEEELANKIRFHLAEKWDELKYKSRSGVVAWKLIEEFVVPLVAEARTEALEEIKRELEGHRVELHDHGTEDVCCGIALGRNDEIDKSIKAIEALNTKE